jgi:hypothetical protein
MVRMKQFSREEAIAIFENGEWKGFTDEEIVKLQLYQNFLCVDFSRFHQAVEKVLNRPVWSHEFAFPDHLQAEYEGRKEKPTFEDIVNLIPKSKIIFVEVGK